MLRRGLYCLGVLLIVMSSCFVLFLQTPALSASNISNEPVLSLVVVSNTFPGFEPAVPGPLNGPVHGTNLIPVENFAPLPNSVTWVQPGTNAYLRTWSLTSNLQSEIQIEAIYFPDQNSAQNLVDDMNLALNNLTGGSILAGTFNVPTVPDGQGYSVSVYKNGSYLTFQVATFRTGNIAYLIFLGSPTTLFSTADAVNLTILQQNKAASIGVPSVAVTVSPTSKSNNTLMVAAIILMGLVTVAALTGWVLSIRNRWETGEGMLPDGVSIKKPEQPSKAPSYTPFKPKA